MIDDWMLLKIVEKISRRNVFEQKKKKPGLSAIIRSSNNCALWPVGSVSFVRLFTDAFLFSFFLFDNLMSA